MAKVPWPVTVGLRLAVSNGACGLVAMLTSRNACNAIAATAKDAATASVRGENPAMKEENWAATARAELRLRAATVSASMAAINRFMQRAEGTPRDSLKEIVSASSSRTRSAWRGGGGS